MLEKDSSGEANARTPNENRDLERLRTLMLSGGALNSTTWNYHLLTYLRRQSLAKILWWNYLYPKIINTPGVILEFGVHYGTTLSTLISLRGLYEPYNYQRDIIGFDTFQGFPKITESDSNKDILWNAGDYATPQGFANHLEEVLGIQERMSPISQIKKHSLVIGDASVSFPEWLKDNPEQLIALLILDMDIYEPTLNVLKHSQERLTKGSIVVLDEIASKAFPGETKAFMEIIGARNVSLRRFPFQPTASYFVVE
jgi:hypothetical protein